MEYLQSDKFTFLYPEEMDEMGATQIYNQVKGQRKHTDTQQAGSDCVIGNR